MGIEAHQLSLSGRTIYIYIYLAAITSTWKVLEAAKRGSQETEREMKDELESLCTKSPMFYTDYLSQFALGHTKRGELSVVEQKNENESQGASGCSAIMGPMGCWGTYCVICKSTWAWPI